jgi:hypothetical protein
MARRSVTNDRYRVEQKGHTRKSASAAKPKREAGESAASSTSKKPVKKGAAKKGATRWGRGAAREPLPTVPSTPQMKALRRYWWILIGTAIVLAVAMIPIQQLKNQTLDSVLFGVYAAALGGALYLEFGPLRRARKAAIAEAKAKESKGGKARANAKAAPEPAAAEPTLTDKVLGFFGRKPKADHTDGVLDVPPSSDNDAASAAAEEASGDDDKKQ